MRRFVLMLALVPGLGCSGDEVTQARTESPPPPTQPEPVESVPPSVDTGPTPTDPGPDPEEQPEPMAPSEGFFMAEGAPDPRACTVASDCHGNTIPDLDNPCCQNPRTLEPYTHAYWSWLIGWRREHCEAGTCPPPPAPSLPPDCAFKPDCVAGRCVDTCP